jgi:hypothetical protein
VGTTNGIWLGFWRGEPLKAQLSERLVKNERKLTPFLDEVVS